MENLDKNFIYIYYIYTYYNIFDCSANKYKKIKKFDRQIIFKPQIYEANNIHQVFCYHIL